MKRYLLTAGDCYYPQSGTGDWIASFDTHTDAKVEVQYVVLPRTLFSKGPRKGQVNEKYPLQHSYVIRGSKHDWYEIIDTEDW